MTPKEMKDFLIEECQSELLTMEEIVARIKKQRQKRSATIRPMDFLAEEESAYAQQFWFVVTKFIYLKNFHALNKIIEAINLNFPASKNYKPYGVSENEIRNAAEVLVKQLEAIGANRSSIENKTLIYLFNASGVFKNRLRGTEYAAKHNISIWQGFKRSRRNVCLSLAAFLLFPVILGLFGYEIQ